MTPSSAAERDVQRARALARALDGAVRIPGTGIGVGLDPIIGLIPGVGDIAGGVLSGYIVLVAARAGAPASVVARMVSNVAIDSLIGTVPLLGDLADFGWKANTRNVALLQQHLERPAAARRASRATVAALLAALALTLVGVVYLGAAAVKMVLGLFD
jgi:hypothetical protein